MYVYKTDKSKLVPIGHKDYRAGQEQANFYLTALPLADEYSVRVTEPHIAKEIADYLDIPCVADPTPLLISIDSTEVRSERPTLYVAVYFSNPLGACDVCVVSHYNVFKQYAFARGEEIIRILKSHFSHIQLPDNACDTKE